MIGAVINSTRFNAGGINGVTISTGLAGSHVVIFNQSDVTLNWTSVPEAVGYFIEVSLFPDFRTIFETTTVFQSSHSFTDSQASGRKRYWRWAATIDGATRFGSWSEVGSYWLDTALSRELTINRNKVALADPDDMLDVYYFDHFPTWVVVKRNLYRASERNRVGELLSEFLTVKNVIELNFEGAQYVDMIDLNEIERFHNDKRTFFVATFKDGERDRPMPHVWLVELIEDPRFTLIAAGRPDLLTGSLAFEEV
jgi:hypothetical protein